MEFNSNVYYFHRVKDRKINLKNSSKTPSGVCLLLKAVFILLEENKFFEVFSRTKMFLKTIRYYAQIPKN